MTSNKAMSITTNESITLSLVSGLARSSYLIVSVWTLAFYIFIIILHCIDMYVLCLLQTVAKISDFLEAIGFFKLLIFAM